MTSRTYVLICTLLMAVASNSRIKYSELDTYCGTNSTTYEPSISINPSSAFVHSSTSVERIIHLEIKNGPTIEIELGTG
jgi:hypothetical protein